MNFKNQIILGSKSPRRRQLLQLITQDFIAESIEVEEDFPDELKTDEVALYLAKKKATAYQHLNGDQIIITSDTTVILDGQILGKPETADEGLQMLQSLSGRWHEVNTGVYISLGEQNISVSEFTKVYFPELSTKVIRDYLERFQPMDKAGAYGIQECCKKPSSLYTPSELSLVTQSKEDFTLDSNPNPSFEINTIHGSFFNVVGFPIVSVKAALDSLR